MSSRQIIVLMETVHQHMVMESRLEKHCIPFQTVVKPRQLGTDCGMALNVQLQVLDAIKNIAEKEKLKIFGIFVRENETWIDWHQDKVSDTPTRRKT